jgi:hypothetical protein
MQCLNVATFDSFPSIYGKFCKNNLKKPCRKKTLVMSVQTNIGHSFKNGLFWTIWPTWQVWKWVRTKQIPYLSSIYIVMISWYPFGPCIALWHSTIDMWPSMFHPDRFLNFKTLKNLSYHFSFWLNMILIWTSFWALVLAWISFLQVGNWVQI